MVGGKFKTMPRTYVKKGTKNHWTDAQLAAAKKAVTSGDMSVRAAGARYGIPKSTLSDHLKGISKKRYGGPSTVLTPAEEKELVTSCLVMQELGFPLTKYHVSLAVMEYLKDGERDSHFRDGIPGRDWWVGFFRRHPELVQRKPEHLPRNRAQAAKPEVRKYTKYSRTSII